LPAVFIAFKASTTVLLLAVESTFEFCKFIALPIYYYFLLHCQNSHASQFLYHLNRHNIFFGSDA
jgi:hypothetical protein